MKTLIFNLLCIATLCVLCGCAKFPNSASETMRSLFPASAANLQEEIELKFGLARITERNGSPSDAEKLYSEVLVSNPKHQDALHRLGVLAMKQDKVAKALEHFSEAVECGDPSGDLLGDYGYAQFLLGNFDDAIENLVAAKAKLPTNERIVNNLAIVVGLMGDKEHALNLFRAVNGEAKALAGLAFVETQAGELDAAAETYHRALDIDPELNIAANGLMQLYQLDSRKSRAASRPANEGSQPARVVEEVVSTRAQREVQRNVGHPPRDSVAAIEKRPSSGVPIGNGVRQASAPQPIGVTGHDVKPTVNFARPDQLLEPIDAPRSETNIEPLRVTIEDPSIAPPPRNTNANQMRKTDSPFPEVEPVVYLHVMEENVPGNSSSRPRVVAKELKRPAPATTEELTNQFGLPNDKKMNLDNAYELPLSSNLMSALSVAKGSRFPLAPNAQLPVELAGEKPVAPAPSIAAIIDHAQRLQPIDTKRDDSVQPVGWNHPVKEAREIPANLWAHPSAADQK